MLTRTIRCKLQCTEEAIAAFLQTKKAFSEACNLILQEALQAKIRNPVELHRLTYAKVREAFGLSANLTVRAIRRVSGSLAKKQKKERPRPKQFRCASIEYDARACP